MTTRTQHMREMAQYLHSADAPEPTGGPGLPDMLDAAANDIERLSTENTRVVHHNADLADDLRTSQTRVRELFAEGARLKKLLSMWLEVNDWDRSVGGLRENTVAAVSGTQERPGLGTYDDGMVALGYRSGSVTDDSRQVQSDG